MGKEIPRRAMRAVILSHRAPLALGEIRSPALPVHFAQARFFETFFFSVHDWPPTLRSSSKPPACERRTQAGLYGSYSFSSHARAGVSSIWKSGQLAVAHCDSRFA